MAFTLIHGEKRIPIGLGGFRTLADILSDEECELVREGSLVAVSDGGGIMSLSSPLEEGQVITFRLIKEHDKVTAYVAQLVEAFLEGRMEEVRDVLWKRRNPVRLVAEAYLYLVPRQREGKTVCDFMELVKAISEQW